MSTERQCPKCHQKVWLGETERGKKVYVNAWSSPRGNVVALDPEADVPMLRFLKKGEEPAEGTRRYLLHRATCRPGRG